MDDIERAARSRLIALRPDNARPVAFSDPDYTITEATAESLINAVPGNTRRAYDHAWAQFTRWSAVRAGVVFELQDLAPAFE